MKKLYILLVAIFATISVNAQTYNNGQWYSVYDTEEHKQLGATAKSWEYDVFAPTTGTLTFDWKKDGWFIGHPILNIYAYESTDGTNFGDALCHISSGTDVKQEDYVNSGNISVSQNINKLKMEIGAGSLNRYFTNITIPLKHHILFDKGDFGSTSYDAKDFGELTWGNTSEPFAIKLRSFYSKGDITVISSLPDIFRIGDANNIAGLKYEVGANACASKNGTANALAKGGTLGQISNYNFNVYFCPQAAQDYSGTITITDGTNTVTVAVSGKGLAKPQTFGSFETIVCPNSTFLFVDGNEYAAGQHTVTLVNSFGGDSIVTLTVNEFEPTSSEFSATFCESYTWNETTYTESGDYEQTFANIHGCDSIVTLHLTINKADRTEFSETACEEYKWNETTYTESGDYEQSFANIHGCDSIVTLHLTINKADRTEFSASSCEEYTWNETTYTESGDYEQAFANIHGCDSIVTLHLTIRSASEDVVLYDTITAGESIEWGNDVIVFELPGDTVLVDSLVNESLCDSVVYLNLHIKEFIQQPEGPTTDVESAQQSAVSSQKILREGQLFILRDDKRYNVLGTKVE